MELKRLHNMSSYKDICDRYNATAIQQLYKIVTDDENGGFKNKDVFPVSVIQSIFDGITGTRLDQILALNNCIYIPFQGTREATRLKIRADMRRKGLIIVFRDLDNMTYTQRYINNNSIADDNWKLDDNWSDCFTSFDDTNFIQQLKQYFTAYIDDKLEDFEAISVDDSLSLESENPVQNKVITEAINRINKELFPLTIAVNGGGLFEKRTSQTVTVTWTVKEGSTNVIPETITVNDEPVTNTHTNKQFTNVTTNTTYTVKATKDGVTVQGSASVTFVNPSYFGPVAATFTPTETAIKALTKSVKNGKGYTGNTSLNNQKVCYAYPKSFGALTSIKDANNFEYINSYTRSELTVWDETYYVYVLTDATTIDSFKQIYS